MQVRVVSRVCELGMGIGCWSVLCFPYHNSYSRRHSRRHTRIYIVEGAKNKTNVTLVLLVSRYIQAFTNSPPQMDTLGATQL